VYHQQETPGRQCNLVNIAMREENDKMYQVSATRENRSQREGIQKSEHLIVPMNSGKYYLSDPKEGRGIVS